MESPYGAPQNAVGTADELLTGAAAASHSQTQAFTLLLRFVINKLAKPFSLFLRNDGPENKGKCRGTTYQSWSIFFVKTRLQLSRVKTELELEVKV